MKSRHSVVGGIISAGIALIIYALVPHVLGTFLNDPSALGIDASGVGFSGIRAVLDRAILYSPVMAVLSFLVGYHRKGDKTRVYAQTARMIGSYIGFLFIVGFGNLGEIISFESGGSSYSISAFFTGLIGVMALLNLLKIPIFYGEYRDHREEFLKEHDPDGYEMFVMGHYDDDDYGYGGKKRRRRRWG